MRKNQEHYSQTRSSVPVANELMNSQGPRSKFSSGGAKEECEKENLGAGVHACGFLFNFFKVTENVNNDKTVNFFSHLQ